MGSLAFQTQIQYVDDAGIIQLPMSIPESITQSGNGVHANPQQIGETAEQIDLGQNIIEEGWLILINSEASGGPDLLWQFGEPAGTAGILTGGVVKPGQFAKIELQPNTTIWGECDPIGTSGTETVEIQALLWEQ